MERKILITEIANFCLKYKLFNKLISLSEVKNRIESQLEDIEFVESLINTIIIKTKRGKNIETKKLKGLLLELERLRLELEYAEV